MKLSLYQVDAFAENLFEGNPAAVVPLQHWPDDTLLQHIAAENNLSETAFFVATDHGFHIRWFTPSTEVQLCGHATLAAAHIVFTELDYKEETVFFDSLSGQLSVSKAGQQLKMNFPAQPPTPCEIPANLANALNLAPVRCLESEDYLAVFASQKDIENLTPNFALLAQLPKRGVIVTAPASRYDFVVRFFAPSVGVNEDPVTGSAYTQLAPYWHQQLGKSKLLARQLSKRGGTVACEIDHNRVLISGIAKTYLIGHIFV